MGISLAYSKLDWTNRSETVLTPGFAARRDWRTRANVCHRDASRCALAGAPTPANKFARENQKPEDSRRSSFDFPIVNKERAWNIIDALIPIAKSHNVSPATIALAYVLAKPFVTSVIIGAKRLDQLKDNLAATDIKLSPEELKQLDDVSALPPEYPGCMLSFQGSNRLESVPRAVPDTTK